MTRESNLPEKIREAKQRRENQREQEEAQVNHD